MLEALLILSIKKCLKFKMPKMPKIVECAFSTIYLNFFASAEIQYQMF
jgi:hypothetical protein